MRSDPSPGGEPAAGCNTYEPVLGLETSGDVFEDAAGRSLSHAETIRNVVEQGVAAEESGVDCFAIAEHHSSDRPLSAPDVVLGAIAAGTSRIRLASAGTVIASDDPVRVFQRFSTLDAVSGGRAEVILGPGTNSGSFPLFGYDRADQALLFEEKTQLFAKLLTGGPVTWAGSTRGQLVDQEVVPYPQNGSFPAWIGASASTGSVVHAARHGYALMLTVDRGQLDRCAGFAQQFREALGRFRRPRLPVGVQSPGYVAATDEQACNEFWPHYAQQMARTSLDSALPSPTEESFLRDIGPDGSLYVGSPDTVAQKIAATLRALGATRFHLRHSLGGLSNEAQLVSIHLYGTQVVPRVRAIASRPAARPDAPRT